jgi:hypothetical protein
MSILSVERARRVKREPVKVGEWYEFYSTLYGEDGYGVECRLYTGQEVKVVADNSDDIDSEIGERLFEVEADDGTRFSAWEGELDGFNFDCNQFYSPEGEWAPR